MKNLADPNSDHLPAYTESLGELLGELLNAADGDLNHPELLTKLAASLAYSTMIQRGADPSIRFTLASRVASALRPVCEDIASSKCTLVAKAMEKRFGGRRSSTGEAQWKWNTGMLKARGIILFDFVLKNGFKDAAIEEEKMERIMNEYVKGSPQVVYYQCDVKPRRGDGHPDIKKLKIRTS